DGSNASSVQVLGSVIRVPAMLSAGAQAALPTTAPSARNRSTARQRKPSAGSARGSKVSRRAITYGTYHECVVPTNIEKVDAFRTARRRRWISRRRRVDQLGGGEWISWRRRWISWRRRRVDQLAAARPPRPRWIRISPQG